MKIPKLKKGNILAIIWQDTNIPEKQGWMSEAEHQDWIASCGSKVLSVGIYISQDKNFINLVGDMDAEQTEYKSILRPINIGKGFIEKIRILK